VCFFEKNVQQSIAGEFW